MYYGFTLIAVINNLNDTVAEVFYCDDCDIFFEESEILEVVDGSYFCNNCQHIL